MRIIVLIRHEHRENHKLQTTSNISVCVTQATVRLRYHKQQSSLYFSNYSSVDGSQATFQLVYRKLTSSNIFSTVGLFISVVYSLKSIRYRKIINIFLTFRMKSNLFFTGNITYLLIFCKRKRCYVVIIISFSNEYLIFMTTTNQKYFSFVLYL